MPLLIDYVIMFLEYNHILLGTSVKLAITEAFGIPIMIFSYERLKF